MKDTEFLKNFRKLIRGEKIKTKDKEKKQIKFDFKKR